MMLQKYVLPVGLWSHSLARPIRYLPIVLFAIVGVADYAGSFASSSDLSIGTDTTITLSRALAGSYLDLYTNDFLFDKPANYQFYNNATVGFFQLTEALGLEGADHPFRAFRVLGGVTTFVFLLGYYLLALYLAGSRIVAFLFACASAVAVPTFSGDFWGLSLEPHPRVLFGALLPYLLLLALQAGAEPRRWIAVFALAGAGVWLHPASGPTVALALMIAMLAANYSGPFSAPPLVRTALISGLVFLAIALPNILQYLAGIRHAGINVDPVLADEARRLRFAAEYLDPGLGVVTALRRIFSGGRLALVVLAMLGIAAVAWLNGRTQRVELKLVVGFLVAVVAISCGVPMLENATARANDANSQQLDLVRSLRYILPIFLLAAFWGASRLPLGTALRGVVAAAIAVFWFVAKDIRPSYRQNAKPAFGAECWLQGKVTCEHPRVEAEVEMLAFIRLKTPPTAKFFSPSYGPSIRAIARRSLAFDWKDTGWLAYSNHARLVESLRVMKRYLDLRNRGRVEDHASAWLAFGRDVGAEYVVLPTSLKAEAPSGQDAAVFSNPAGAIVAIGKQSDTMRQDGLTP